MPGCRLHDAGKMCIRDSPQVVLNQLYRYTQLQDTVGVIMLALDDGVPKIMSLKTMMQRYLDEITGGRGVVFATGTPVSNSMTEMCIRDRYQTIGFADMKDMMKLSREK